MTARRLSRVGGATKGSEAADVRGDFEDVLGLELYLNLLSPRLSRSTLLPTADSNVTLNHVKYHNDQPTFCARRHRRSIRD